VYILGLLPLRILLIRTTAPDELRPISLPYLNNILQFILNILVARLLKHESAPVELLTRDLDVEHEISPSVARQVLEWFGEITGGGRWKMNVDEVIREVGLGILRQHKAANPIATGELLRKWKDAVGDAFEDRVGLTLLAVSPSPDMLNAIACPFHWHFIHFRVFRALTFCPETRTCKPVPPHAQGIWSVYSYVTIGF